MKNIAVLIIGNEVLSGRVRDSNLKTIASHLKPLGWMVEKALVIRDDVRVISQSLKENLSLGRSVITSGGLGPTSDDLTRQGLADALGVKLIQDPELMSFIRNRLESIGHPETPLHRAYALRPQGFEAVENPVGIAPGLLWQNENQFVLALPGVPREAEAVLKNALASLSTDEARILPEITVAIAGLTEAEIAQKLSEILPESSGFYPREFEVILKCKTKSAKDAESLKNRINRVLGHRVYSFEDEPLENTVGKLLRKKGLSLALAESCTGGLVSRLITSVPGASDYYVGGVVSYQTRIKSEILRVPEELIEKHTVYSPEVAEAMARGVAELLGSDIGLSTTCVAGPGEDQGHPPGSLFVGLSFGSVQRSFGFRLSGDRPRIQRAAAKQAIDVLRVFLQTGEL